MRSLPRVRGLLVFGVVALLALAVVAFVGRERLASRYRLWRLRGLALADREKAAELAASMARTAGGKADLETLAFDGSLSAADDLVVRQVAFDALWDAEPEPKASRAEQPRAVYGYGLINLGRGLTPTDAVAAIGTDRLVEYLNRCRGLHRTVVFMELWRGPWVATGVLERAAIDVAQHDSDEPTAILAHHFTGSWSRADSAEGIRASPHADMRLACFARLEEGRHPESFDVLQAALADGDERVRIAAAYGLAVHHHDRSGLRVLLRGLRPSLRDDPGLERTAARAAHGLGAISDRCTLRVLVDGWSNATVPAVRRALDDALVAMTGHILLRRETWPNWFEWHAREFPEQLTVDEK